MKKTLIIILFLLCLIFVYPDKIITKDGNTLSGKVIKMDTEEIIIETDFGTFTVKRENIKKLEMEYYDKIVTNDGSEIAGKIVSWNDKEVVIETTMGKMTIKISKIKELHMTNEDNKSFKGFIIMDVKASKGWQKTGIELGSNSHITIEYLSGEWNTKTWPNLEKTGPDGYPDVAQTNDATANFRYNYNNEFALGTLLGMIGRNKSFKIGKYFESKENSTGKLQVRVNEADSLLSDNEGSIKIKIVVK
jgi:hypothetical protein